MVWYFTVADTNLEWHMGIPSRTVLLVWCSTSDLFKSRTPSYVELEMQIVCKCARFWLSVMV